MRIMEILSPLVRSGKSVTRIGFDTITEAYVEMPEADVVEAGSPCTDFSVIGAMGGVNARARHRTNRHRDYRHRHRHHCRRLACRHPVIICGHRRHHRRCVHLLLCLAEFEGTTTVMLLCFIALRLLLQEVSWAIVE